MASRLMKLAFLAVASLQHAVVAAPAEAAISANVAPSGGQVLVDHDGIYMRATRLQDGSILGGYAAQQGGDKVLRVARSRDEGSSWTVIGTVSSVESATHELDNAFPVQLPGGRILFAFRNHDRLQNGEFTYYRITVCYSDDSGITWKFLSQVDERAANGVNGLWEPFLRIAKDGSVQAYYSAENSGQDQDNVMKISRNGGQSWEGPYPVSGQDRTSRDGMTGVADVDDNGKLICVFENTESGPFSVDAVFSHDDGRTWDSRRRIYTASNGREAGAPDVVKVGGNLVVSFMTNENTDTPRLDGGEMKVVISSDGGGNWSKSTVTGSVGSHWAGLFSLSSTEFMALYAQDGHGLVSQKYSV